jgi:alkylhydroperoxidase/carboxymuconolactone decarboxylase family protein YurZ
MNDITLPDLRALARTMAASAPEGGALNSQVAGLVAFAVAASVTSLDVTAMESAARRALDAGASTTQLHEVLTLVSGLGVHSLMVGSPLLARVARERGDTAIDAEPDAERVALWRANVGDDPFWARMQAEVPGFLDSLLRLSPQTFEEFFRYCALPWATRSVRAVSKELIAMAVDATPTHRFAPGFRLHLANALQLGASRGEVEHSLNIAAAAPAHSGVR